MKISPAEFVKQNPGKSPNAEDLVTIESLNLKKEFSDAIAGQSALEWKTTADGRFVATVLGINGTDSKETLTLQIQDTKTGLMLNNNDLLKPVPSGSKGVTEGFLTLQDLQDPKSAVMYMHCQVR